ncbi:hypothetical protein MLD38_038467 [Melastoma candidum]|uniref:Uncharacterized protein n=1 Tax=Melastoma candidum TaxID=119954 RepID=A0ACB9L1A8_9MYRT|nr:hypothetical protein MLD38_038467 [Melastoma candidum]
MREAKVRPIMTGSSYHHLVHEIQLEGDCGSFNGGLSGVPGSVEYRLARREFLKSYSFSSSAVVTRCDRPGGIDGRWLKGRLANSVRGARDAAVGALVDAHRGISRRRLTVRVFRLRLSLFASPGHTFVVTVKCFVPCINKVEA